MLVRGGPEARGGQIFAGWQPAGFTHVRFPAPGSVLAGRGRERTAVDPRGQPARKIVVITVSELTDDVTKALKGNARDLCRTASAIAR